MASPIVERIGKASKDAWPQVSAGIAQSMRSLQELAEISDEVVPKVEEYVARGANGSIRRRKVCEETIWVLANLGYLRTGPEREVLLAAKNWFDVVEDENVSEDEIVMAEDQLADTIKSLPEYMTAATPKES
jgi:hypothetical protein